MKIETEKEKQEENREREIEIQRDTFKTTVKKKQRERKSHRKKKLGNHKKIFRKLIYKFNGRERKRLNGRDEKKTIK